MSSKIFIRIKDKNTNIVSNEISIEDLIYNQNEIEFRFAENKSNYSTLPYDDFLYYQDEYEVIIRIDEKMI